MKSGTIPSPGEGGSTTAATAGRVRLPQMNRWGSRTLLRFLQENGGQVELRTNERGAVAGVCVFPDGSECDEWEYYRGTCNSVE